ncbi:MAG: O-antigen ligase family protein [Candidatus Omnitrophica bacterium]|nr:O-antigen ligase family protein [Candidatus Omnitrophota bacterium]
MSFSRGAMLGVCMGIGFSVFVFFYHLRQKKIQAYAVLYAAGLLIIIVSKISLGESAQFGFLNRETDTRKSVWVDTFKMIKDRPFFGHGSNTYMEVFQDKYRSYSIKKYYETIEFVKHAPTYAHNCFLQIWAETGIFSLLAFLWILFKMFQDSIRQIKIFFRQHDHFLFISMGLLSGLFAFLTQSFFDTNFYSLQLSAYFWYMAGIVMVINRFTIQQEGVGQHG